MASKKVKRKNRAMAKANQANGEAQKAYIGGGYGGYYGYGQANTDYRPDEWGISQAYTFNVAVKRAINFWEQWLSGLNWAIHAPDDSILIDSSKRRIPDGKGAKFAKALKAHEHHFKHDYFASLAFSDKLYGESYTRFVCNEWGMAQLLEWLNPLAVEPNIMQGKIRDYRYSGDEGFAIIEPKDIAFRIAMRNSQNDLRGDSPVLSVIDVLSIDKSEKLSLKTWFKNNMMLGGLMSPSSNEVSLSPAQIQKLEDQFRRDYKGAANAGKMAIAPANMEIEMFPVPDIEKNYAIVKPLRDEILMAMGVYPQLAGDPSAADYDSAADVKRQWCELFGIPYARNIEGYINTQILPVLEPYTDVYFAFDTSPFEVERPEVVSADFSAGIVDMFQAAELRGYDGDPQLKGVYLINNVPMAKDVILKLAHSVPSQYALDYANAATAGQTPNVNADAITIAKPIPHVLPSGEAPAIEIPLQEKTPVAASIDVKSIAPEHSHSHDYLPPLESTNADELAELGAWRRFMMSGKSAKRSFEQKALRGDIGDMLQAAVDSHDKQTILDTFLAAQTRIENRIKTIQATRLDFEGDFDELLKRARAEKMGRVQWASAMRTILRRYGLKAYMDGMADGGVEDEPTEDDRITINELVANQSGYVTELGNVLYKGDGISDEYADVKAAMWFNKSVQPLYQAGLESAAINSLFEWAYGDTEHCEDCQRLNGQRHRLKGWKANFVPQGDTLSCQGFNCKCRLVMVRGRQRGNY
jgi:phage portal protein BeeE